MAGDIAPGPVRHCSTHSRARAAWECANCGKLLCPACAAADYVERMGEVVRCVHCGDLARQLMVEKPTAPWWKMLPTFLASIFSPRGLGQMLVVAVFLVIAGFMAIVPLVGWIFKIVFLYGIIASYMFLVLQSAANGGRKLPSLAEMGRDFSDIASSALRLVLAAAPAWVPLVVYLYGYVSNPLERWMLVATIWHQPLLLALVIFAVFYLPAALILAALAESALAAANPINVLAVVLRAPRQYLAIVIFFAALGLGNAYLQPVLARGLVWLADYSLLRTLVLLPVLTALKLIVPTLNAMVLGWFIHQNARAFERPEYREPVAAYPGARPRGRLPEPEPAGAQTAAREEIPEALELESTPEEALAGALKLGNDTVALDAYRRLSAAGRVPALEVEQELALATMLEGAGDLKAAVRALQRAVKQDPAGPRAPDALFQAARILHDGLGARADAQKIAGYLREKFPDHELARQAQRFLA